MELSPAFMVLRPSREAAQRVTRALELTQPAPHDDECGEQGVWRQVYDRVNELPAAYSALKTSALTESEWARVLVVHDVNLLRRGRWQSAAISAVVAELTAAAGLAFAPAEKEVRDAAKGRPRPRLPAGLKGRLFTQVP
eukprot:6798177-Prymnesium_polylepis.1